MIQIPWGAKEQHSFLQNEKWWLKNPLSVQLAQYRQTYLHFQTRTQTGTFCAQTLHSKGATKKLLSLRYLPDGPSNARTEATVIGGVVACDGWPWHTGYRLKAEPTQEQQRPASVTSAPRNCTWITFERRARQTSSLSELWVYGAPKHGSVWQCRPLASTHSPPGGN